MKPAKLLVLSLSLSICASAVAQGSDLKSDISTTTCQKVPLSKEARPGWSVSGSWVSPTELVVVDALNNRLLRYSSAGDFLGTEPSALSLSIKSKLEDTKLLPSSISTAGNDSGAWLQLLIGKFVKFDADQSVERAVDIRDLRLKARQERGKLVAILRWTTASDDSIFGFGNFRMDDGKLDTGFFRASLGDPPGGTILKRWPEDHLIQLWYRLGFSYVTTDRQGNGYALELDADRNLQIVRNPRGTRDMVPLQALPAELKTLPSLPEFVTPGDYVKLMAQVETSTLPVGLFSWSPPGAGDDYLYVVWRRVDAKGQREWLITKIDPKTDQLIGTAQLPGSADHLMVVPGPDQWALIEKGPVLGFGIQLISRIILVPAQQIADFSPGSTICR